MIDLSRSPRVALFAVHQLSRAALVVLLSVVLSACGDDVTRPDVVDGGAGSASFVPSGPCANGEVRECGFTVDQNEGISTCFHGVQECDDGRWTGCMDEEGVEVDRETSRDIKSYHPGNLRLQALSGVSAIDCDDDCDPQCMHFIEGTPTVPPPSSSGGSTGTPDYPGTPDTNQCPADLCTVQAALSSAAPCNPCVTTVCAVDASCCSTAWDDTCVDLVYTECVGTTPPADLCEWGIFAESTVTLADRNGTVADVGSIGNIEFGTDAHPGRVVTSGNLTIRSGNGAQTISEGIQVGGNIVFQDAGAGSLTADIHAGGSIDTSGGITINGDLYAGTSITGQNTAFVVGDIYAGTTIGMYPNVSGGGTKYPGSVHAPPVIGLPPEIPSRTLTCSGANVTVASGATRTLSPGNYGDVLLSPDSGGMSGSVLILQPGGDYTFNSLIVSTGCTNCKIQLGTSATFAPTDQWDLGVCGAFQLGGERNMITNGSGTVLTQPERLVVYVDGGNVGPMSVAAYLGNRVQFTGVLLAPNGKILYQNGCNPAVTSPPTCPAGFVAVRGVLWGNTVQMGPDSGVQGMNLAACQALGFGDPTGGVCPIDNTVPGVPGSTVEPCESGADCQINQRCEEAFTAAECSHSKCVWGEALDASCDSCVERICATVAGATCCTDEWTLACTDMVETVCDASCGAPVGAVCWHDLCDTGEGLAIGCDATEENCTTTVCSTPGFAYCCDTSDPTGWDAACVAEAADNCGSAGATACDYTVVWKDAYAPGAGTTLTPNTNSNVPVVPTRSLTCPTGGSNLAGTRTLSGGGTYGTLSTSDYSGQILRLNTGTYNVQNLNIGAQTTLRISGAVVLNVCGSVAFGQQATITGLPATAVGPRNLQLYVRGNLSAGPGATLGGIFIGGVGSTLSLAGTTSHRGVLWSNGRVELPNTWGGASVTNPMSRADCLAAGLVSATPVCDAVTPSGAVSEGGSCVSNEDAWTSPYCSGYDLAVNYVCESNNVPVCNHGDSNFTGNATIGYWEVADEQFADETPDLGASSYGTCSAFLDISPGTCIDVDCPVPPGADMTYMVDPAGVLSECNGHRLDNWSYKDASYTCPSTAPSTVEYEYEATCPSDSRALWNNLTWDTAVPAGSSLTFRGQVVDDLTDVDPTRYTDLGVAEVAPIDTTDCQVSGPNPPCPIELTDGLGLGANQGRFLSIQVAADHTGGAPVINDWTVSYTCRVDQ